MSCICDYDDFYPREASNNDWIAKLAGNICRCAASTDQELDVRRGARCISPFDDTMRRRAMRQRSVCDFINFQRTPRRFVRFTRRFCVRTVYVGRTAGHFNIGVSILSGIPQPEYV
uniref:Uncharacterized protein n=1 Tax=Ascaris lumbricoides TaxID=6252 RepID=A0A0M3IIY9_ASCLU